MKSKRINGSPKRITEVSSGMVAIQRAEMALREKFINPLEILAGKQLVQQIDADKIAMLVLVALHATKRGRASAGLANTLTEHLLASAAIWSQQGNRPLYDRAVKAWDALCEACARPTELLDLTTANTQQSESRSASTFGHYRGSSSACLCPQYCVTPVA